ncbi:MAG: hypothetical protein QM777_10830 [Pseudorhodoferax sp.]
MSDFLESVRRVHAEMHPDKVLFYEEENGAVDNSGMSHHDVGRRLEAWAGQREGSPHAYLQSGTVREHLAAAPMAWCTAILFVLALAVFAVAGMTDRGAALLKGYPMAARAAANGYLYGGAVRILSCFPINLSNT